MERNFAGILGLIAFLTTLARGWGHHAAIEQTIWQAWQALWAFAGLGFVLGWLAGRTVDEAVRTRFANELASQQANSSPTKTSAASSVSPTAT